MHGVTLASLARDFGWFVEDEEAVNAVESALRTGAKVGLWMESGEGRELLGGATGRVEVVEEVRMLWQKALGAALVVTHRLLEEELEGLPFPVGVVRPRDLSVGLDCDRGVTLEEVEGCVFEGLREGRLAWASVRKLGS
ncbi:MAG: cobalamin biosynthesis central domain-containing protein, partial [Nitrospinota bacterium]